MDGPVFSLVDGVPKVAPGTQPTTEPTDGDVVTKQAGGLEFDPGGGAPTTPTPFARVPFFYDLSDTHVVSPGVTVVDLECWGGGGGGSCDAAEAVYYSSGGGAGYQATYNVPVVEGDALDIHSGGPGAGNGAGAPAGTGDNSRVTDATPTVLCRADGGAGGEPGGPGTGGTGNTGDHSDFGQDGIWADITIAKIVPDGGGAGGPGGAGGRGPNGPLFGGTGTPSYGGGGNGQGGTGGHGRVIVWEYQPTP